MKYIIFTILIVTIPFISFAHEDTPIKLKKNGNLIGLPAKYANAQFDSVTFTLRINNQQIITPDCIKRYFIDLKSYKLKFSASWYHLPDWTMPYYLAMEIISPDNSKGFQVLFNLETLEIFQISKIQFILHENHLFPQFHEQEIEEECRKDILSSITNL